MVAASFLAGMTTLTRWPEAAFRARTSVTVQR
jgi:hypothetical protein